MEPVVMSFDSLTLGFTWVRYHGPKQTLKLSEFIGFFANHYFVHIRRKQSSIISSLL